MTWKKALSSFALLAACVGTGAASAQTADQKSAFRSTDLNRSGTVSWEEFRNYAIVSFHDLDADHDGTVTPAEYAGIKDAVSMKDYNAELAAYFDQYDSDENGSLDLVEWVAVPDPKHPVPPKAPAEAAK